MRIGFIGLGNMGSAAIEDDAGVELRAEGDWLVPWEVKHPTEA